jgi:hypothetical protein
MAAERSGDHDPQCEALAVARRGQQRRRSRHLGAITSKCADGNAVLDGLWIEGGALPDAFHAGELIQIGLESFSALLDVDLISDD